MPLAGGGFGYTAFVIDAYAGLIPGWECSTSKQAHALWLVPRSGFGAAAEGSVTETVSTRRDAGMRLIGGLTLASVAKRDSRSSVRTSSCRPAVLSFSAQSICFSSGTA